jgi:uncharacterized protein (DUF2164 family)
MKLTDLLETRTRNTVIDNFDSNETLLDFLNDTFGKFFRDNSIVIDSVAVQEGSTRWPSFVMSIEKDILSIKEPVAVPICQFGVTTEGAWELEFSFSSEFEGGESIKFTEDDNPMTIRRRLSKELKVNVLAVNKFIGLVNKIITEIKNEYGADTQLLKYADLDIGVLIIGFERILALELQYKNNALVYRLSDFDNKTHYFSVLQKDSNVLETIMRLVANEIN